MDVAKTGSERKPEMRATIAAIVVAVALGTAGAAHATFAGHNGKIVFRSNRTGNADIYTASPDGSNRVQLTTSPSEDVDPRWSADGTRIVFASDRTGIFQIYTMTADGTDVRQLTTLPGHNRRPSWTADGRILFHSDVDDAAQARDVFVMNADGSGLTNLTQTPGVDDAYAAAAPRGSKIVVTSDRAGGGYGLFLLNRNAPARQLTSGGNDFEANWSPSGNDLVFVRFDPAFSTSDLYVMHVDGSGLVRQLTHTPDRIEFEPAWSPDGTQIVFHSCNSDYNHCVNNVMNADGTGETDVSTPRLPYLDTFDGPQIDPFWGQPFVQGNGPTVEQTNGQLEIGVPASTTNDPSAGYISAGVNTQCRLNGDFDAQVDYRLLQWPATPMVNADFDTFSQANGWQAYGLFVFDPGGLGTGVSTNFPGPVNTYIPDASSSGTLRFSRSGDTLTTYRLVNGAWAPIQSILDTQTDVGLDLNVFSNAAPGTHGDVKIAYDNVRIAGAALSCPTWWDDNAPDWQAR
jgi:Tol biopolymer transport system component